MPEQSDLQKRVDELAEAIMGRKPYQSDSEEVEAEQAKNSGSASISSRELAELRRLNPASPPAAFWRLLADKVPRWLCHDDTAERAWGVVMQGMAIMGPGGHAPGIILGKALRQVVRKLGANSERAVESRLWKLLNSRGEPLEDQVRLMARFLDSKEQCVDWLGLTQLLLARSEAERDRVCRNLARTFYFAQSQPEPESHPEPRPESGD
ncbi:MAG: type I-E CRISPR-associated protein Cse2/CasB [Desulfovibrionaceae bacterium]